MSDSQIQAKHFLGTFLITRLISGFDAEAEDVATVEIDFESWGPRMTPAELRELSREINSWLQLLCMATPRCFDTGDGEEEPDGN